MKFFSSRVRLLAWRLGLGGKELVNAFRDKKCYEQVNTFCIFIGSGKNGSTLVGALLDAHPNIVIANELDALKYVHRGCSKNLLFSLIRKRNTEFVHNECKVGGGGHAYDIPNQWQGKFKTIHVIGDKHGGVSTERFQAHSELLQRLKDVIGVKIRFIHVIRNPYDAISTFVLWKNKDFEWAIDKYFSRVKTVTNIKERTPYLAVFDIKLESLIDDPKLWLKRLCEFLGQEAPKDYLDDCASIVYKKPHKSRFGVKWTPELIELVKGKMAGFEFLDGYSYKE